MEEYEVLEKALGVPAPFAHVLRRLVTPEECRILALITGEFHAASALLGKLGEADLSKVSSTLEALYQRGIVDRRAAGEEFAYRCRSFYDIVSQHLQEGRYEALGVGNLHALRSYYISTRIEKTDESIRRGRLSHSSRVIPIGRAFPATQYVLPLQQAIEFLKEARIFALTNCGCRVAFRYCENPVETCLLLDEEAEYLISRGYARQITLEEAKRVLEIADKAGLVHLTLYLPGNRVYAICSCCPCCCHDLQALLKYGMLHFVAKADYIATVDADLCNGCGICVERCLFGARKVENGKSTVVAERCYGCGLCVTSCPTNATKLTPRKGDGV